jgi:hypothetical protein
LGSTAGFTVSGGQILDPSGHVWHGQGVGVLDQQISGLLPPLTSGAALANQIRSLMPGINLIRIANYQLGTPASYAPFVAVMTAAKVVCVFENHDPNNPVYTGVQLANESAWYASLASYYLGNPYVWFQTVNEPGSGDYLQMTATYNAIRGTGNNTIIFFEAGLGSNADPTTLGSTTFTNSMHNIGWDVHNYGATYGYSTDVPTIIADENSRIAAMQTITSGDGLMPVICLETGTSSTNVTIDVDAVQSIQGTFACPNFCGVAAWIWDSYYAGQSALNNLTIPGGNSLSSYGRQVAGYVADGASTFATSSGGPITGATASTYIPVTADIGNMLAISVVAKNASGSSAPATSAATSAVTAASGVPVNTAPGGITLQ